MNYLKLTNAPLSILKDEKYNGKTDDVDWTYCGFNKNVVSKFALGYRDDSGDFIQYVPISDETKLENILIDFQADLAELGEEHTAEVVADDRDQWLLDVEASKKPKFTDAEQVIQAGFSLRGKVTPVTDMLYFIQLAQAGKQIVMAGDVTTQTVTIPSASGSYEATLDDLNAILAGLETIRSQSIKVEFDEVAFEDITMPLVLDA